MCEHALHAAVFAQQLQRGLFAHARHAGDVVGSVAHEAFEVGHLRGSHAVLREHRGRVELDRIADAAAGIEHVRRIRHQLQSVAVAGDKHGGQPRLLAPACERAENIVRLERRHLDDRRAHRPKQLLHARKLRAQPFVGGLAGAFIGVVRQMAESGAVHVERHGEVARLVFPEHLQQHAGEAVNGVRRVALAVVQLGDGVKGAVHQAVAVDGNEQSVHKKGPLSCFIIVAQVRLFHQCAKPHGRFCKTKRKTCIKTNLHDLSFMDGREKHGHFKDFAKNYQKIPRTLLAAY